MTPIKARLFVYRSNHAELCKMMRAATLFESKPFTTAWFSH